MSAGWNSLRTRSPSTSICDQYCSCTDYREGQPQCHSNTQSQAVSDMWIPWNAMEPHWFMLSLVAKRKWHPHSLSSTKPQPRNQHECTWLHEHQCMAQFHIPTLQSHSHLCCVPLPSPCHQGWALQHLYLNGGDEGDILAVQSQVTGDSGWDIWHLQQENIVVYSDGSGWEEEGCTSFIPSILSTQQ